MLLQNGILLELVGVLKEIKGKKAESPGREDTVCPQELCGWWESPREGICLYIRKASGGCYACLPDKKGTGRSYPIRTYRGMCYFTLDSYAIFIERDRAGNGIRLCGKLPLREGTQTGFYPGTPPVFNPN